MIEIAEGVTLAEADIRQNFVKASGPGGQHVNKVATAVQLSLDVANAPGIPERVYRRLSQIAGKRLSPEGILTIECSSHRSQFRNRGEALEKLIALLREATQKPKRRRPTKPSRAAKRRRMDQKTKRGKLKSLRGKVKGED